MKIKDVIELAKTGYKPSEIKQLLTHEGITTTEIVELAKSGYTVNDIEELIELDETTPDNDSNNGSNNSSNNGSNNSSDNPPINAFEKLVEDNK